MGRLQLGLVPNLLFERNFHQIDRGELALQWTRMQKMEVWWQLPPLGFPRVIHLVAISIALRKYKSRQLRKCSDGIRGVTESASSAIYLYSKPELVPGSCRLPSG